MVQVTPVLNEGQIGRIAETAKLLVSSLPPPSGDPKTPNHNKKKVSKEVEVSHFVFHKIRYYDRFIIHDTFINTI